MMAMPIWLSMVWLRLLVKINGAASRITANKVQTMARPTLSGLNS
jgi:hypothetical protein